MFFAGMTGDNHPIHKFQDGKLSFTRKAKFNDNEFEMTVTGASRATS